MTLSGKFQYIYDHLSEEAKWRVIAATKNAICEEIKGSSEILYQMLKVEQVRRK